MDWCPLESAPRDGKPILLLTSDFGAVQGWWDASVTNFYKSQEGWASYDPDNAQGDWVSDWHIGDDDDYRLYCGATPHAWAPLPKLRCGVCHDFRRDEGRLMGECRNMFCPAYGDIKSADDVCARKS